MVEGVSGCRRLSAESAALVGDRALCGGSAVYRAGCCFNVVLYLLSSKQNQVKSLGGFWILHLHQFDVDDSCSDDVMEAEIKTKKGKRAGNWKIPRFDLYAFWGPLPPHSMQGQVCIDSLNNWSHCKENPSWFWRGQRGAVLGFDWLHVDRSCRYHT